MARPEKFDLSSTFVHLGLGSVARELPDFAWTEEYLDSYTRETAGDVAPAGPVSTIIDSGGSVSPPASAVPTVVAPADQATEALLERDRGGG